VDRRTFVKQAALGAAGAGTLGALSACGSAGTAGEEAAAGQVAVSGPEVTWRVASSFPRGLDIIYGSAEALAQRVRDMTAGRFTLRIYPAGELVPGLQVMDAVQNGTVQAGHTAGYYYTGKHPALALDTGVPVGLTARQQNAWLYEAGGLDLTRGVYADFGIINFPCGNTGVQMGGWFRRPIGSLSDLRGLRMRIPGIGGEVMSRLGVSVQLLAGGEIFLALERGAIDATEWVGAYDDEKLGFHRIASHYYYPGWHEPGVTLSLMVNREAWDELPDLYKRVLETACRATNEDMLVRYDAANPPALQRLIDEHGVQVRAFPQDFLRAAWRESNAYLEELAGSNAEFARVYNPWKRFRAETFRYFAGNEQSYMTIAFAENVS